MPGGGGGSLTDLELKMSSPKYLLYAILLYSDTDANFIRFLEYSHASLATMAGDKVFLFWFENFEDDIKLLLKLDNEPPTDKSKVMRMDSLRLAKVFAIPMSNTPCLLLCKSLEDTGSIAYSFDNSWSHEHLAEHFKTIFDHIDEVLAEYKHDSVADVYGLLEKRFKKLKNKKWIKRVVSNQSVGNVLRAIAMGA